MGCGAFGKIPAAGDFVRLGLSPGFVDPWDRWMQEGIAAAREALGARWQMCFFSAPIWRFSLAPGLAGRQGMLGILMASVDRVGRQFPLTLAMEAEAPHHALHLNADALFERLEDIALSVLDDLPLADLGSLLAGVQPAVAATLAPGAPGMWRIDGAASVAPAIAAPHLSGAALFSARSGDGLRLMQGENLPTGARFAALFDLDAPQWRAAS